MEFPSEPWEHTLPISHPSLSSIHYIIITTEILSHMKSGCQVRPCDPDCPAPDRQNWFRGHKVKWVSELNED